MDCLVQGGLGGPVHTEGGVGGPRHTEGGPGGGGGSDEEARGLVEQHDNLEIESGGLEEEPKRQGQGQGSNVEPEGLAREPGGSNVEPGGPEEASSMGRRARRAGQTRAFVNNVCSFLGGLGNVLIRVNLFIDLSILYIT